MTKSDAARLRVIAKQDGKVWSPYDTLHGSWPREIPGFGKVQHNLKTEEEAAREAERLDKFFRTA